mmetsp:Transcript_8988/g.29786  ORF Transcript_8988/g.29786 Transcript_8988/m.29786 type:complete len:224 (-) Transcript_8988:1583-2254(-)
MARTCLEAAGTRFGQEPARARRSLRRRGNTAHTQSSCGARSGARATRALHRALNPVAPPSLPTWGKCRHMVGQCRASVRVLRLVLWLHRLCELGVGARGRVGPDGLVGGVGGRHKHRVLLGHLGILEELLARVLRLEGVDLVARTPQARDAAAHRGQQCLLVRHGELAARAGARQHLLRLSAFERILPVQLPLLSVVVVLLTEHGQRMRSHDVHRLGETLAHV